jgi:superfamily II RNA helicase
MTDVITQEVNKEVITQEVNKEVITQELNKELNKEVITEEVNTQENKATQELIKINKATQDTYIYNNNNLIHIFKDSCNHVIQDPAFTFNFKCDHFQNHSFHCISQDENVLICAHTGSGKTLPAIYAIAHYLKKNKKIIYTTPIKALSNQKYNELKEIFKDETIGLLTGDRKVCPDSNILIMTTEILLNALYSYKNVNNKEEIVKDSIIDELGCVIFDEVHYINDKQRGTVWEQCLMMLNPNITLVMLSATISQPELFASWLAEIKQKKITLLATTHRVVPLEYSVFSNNKLVTIVQNNNFIENSYINLKHEGVNPSFMINNLTKCLIEKDLLPALYFVFSRKNTEKYAKIVTQQLVTPEESCNISKIFDNYMHRYESKYSKLPQYILIKSLIAKGIAFHHSGMLSVLREIVEILFQKKLIKILMCTETMGVGLNVPSRTVVFTELSKFDGVSSNRLLNTGEFKQIAGRAGRRGFDTQGQVVILPLYELCSTSNLKQVMFGNLNKVESKFTITYEFILQMLYNSNNIKHFVEKSLFMQSNHDDTININLELVNLNTQLVKYDLMFSKDDLIALGEYDKYEKLELEYSKIGFKLNASQLKSKKALHKKLLGDANYKEKYIEYINYKNLSSLIENKNKDKHFSENIIDILSGQIITVLTKLDYIKEDKLSIKGIIAAQIHECNSLVLSEMIMQELFYNLSPEEICGLLGIFIKENKDKDKDNDNLDINNIKNFNIKEKIVKVNTIVDNIIVVERENKYLNNEVINITYDFVEIAYLWGSGCDFNKILEIKEIYLGNFVKNILSLNNILQDVVLLSKIAGKIDNLKNLDLASKMLLRDIVGIESLYL